MDLSQPPAKEADHAHPSLSLRIAAARISRSSDASCGVRYWLFAVPTCFQALGLGRISAAAP